MLPTSWRENFSPKRALTCWNFVGKYVPRIYTPNAGCIIPWVRHRTSRNGALGFMYICGRCHCQNGLIRDDLKAKDETLGYWQSTQSNTVLYLGFSAGHGLEEWWNRALMMMKNHSGWGKEWGNFRMYGYENCWALDIWPNAQEEKKVEVEKRAILTSNFS